MNNYSNRINKHKTLIKFLNDNLLDKNTQICISELISSNFNNTYYLKSLLSNEKIDEILENIYRLINHHKKKNEKLTLSFNFKKDCFILNFKDDIKNFNIFDNQENLVNIINYLSNTNFQEIINN